MSQHDIMNPAVDTSAEHWTARFARPVIFVIITMIAIGAYLAFTIPVAVFPETDFPRIVVGIDNGVAPISQMQVMVTRPVEEAMNSVPGLEVVRSITSRGTGAPVSSPHGQTGSEQVHLRGQSDAGLQPDVDHHVADRVVGTGHLHHQ